MILSCTHSPIRSTELGLHFASPLSLPLHTENMAFGVRTKAPFFRVSNYLLATTSRTPFYPSRLQAIGPGWSPLKCTQRAALAYSVLRDTVLPPDTKMFTLPSWEDAREVRAACARGDLDEAKRVYERSFDSSKWGFPKPCSELYEACDRAACEVESQFHEWRMQWIASAASGNHMHLLKWILSLDTDDYDDSNDRCDPRLVAIAKAYLERMCSPGGTVEDALTACGKGWWPYIDYASYERRLCWGMEYEYDHMRRLWYPTRKKMCPVRRDFVLTAEYRAENPDIVFFTHCTPEHVEVAIEQEQEGCHSCIIWHTICKADDCYLAHAPDCANGSRLLRIAEALVDMGFAFDDYIFFRLDSCHDAMRGLMHKMVRIHGGRRCVCCKLPRYDEAVRRARINVLTLRCATKLLVAAIRARQRAWVPDSAHVVALGANFDRLKSHPQAGRG